MGQDMHSSVQQCGQSYVTRPSKRLLSMAFLVAEEAPDETTDALLGFLERV